MTAKRTDFSYNLSGNRGVLQHGCYHGNLVRISNSDSSWKRKLNAFIAFEFS